MRFIDRYKRIVVPCVLLAVLGTTEPAHGEAVLNREAPAANVYADALLRSAVTVADQVWQDHGDAARCAAQVYVYDEPDGETVARATIVGCKVWFDRHYRDTVWSIYTNRKLSLVLRRDYVAKLCAVATHERGHNLGLDHDAGYVMAAPPFVVPSQCTAWANTVLPTRRNRDKRHRKH